MKKISALLLAGLLFTASCSSNTNVPVTTNVSTANNAITTQNINVGKVPHGIGYTAGFVYNSNIGDKTVSVIDTKTDKVVKTVNFEGTPGYVKAFHDGKYIIITDTEKNKINIIDPSQDHKIIQQIDLSSTPDKILISEDDLKVFVSLPNQAKLAQLNFTDRTKAPEIKYLNTGNVLADEEHRALALDKEWLLIPNSADNDVSLLNIEKNTIKPLKDGNNPGTVGIGSIDGQPKVAIIGNKASNTITLFDIDSDNKTTLSDVGNSPTETLVIPQLKRAFITMAGSNEVSVIDYSSKKLVAKVPTGKRPVHIYLAPDLESFATKHEGHEHSYQIWVGNDDGASVTVFDGKTLEVKANINTDKGHHKMSFSQDKAYVSNISANNITVINRKDIK